MVLAGLTPIEPTNNVVVTLLGVNALAVLLLLGIIGREVWHILQARRRGRAAARLHVHIVGLFSVIAAVPAILVAVVASVTLDRGLDRLFSTRARSMIENSLIVADAYVREHAQSIRADADAMAIDVRAQSRCSIRTASGSANSSPRRPRCATCRGDDAQRRRTRSSSRPTPAAAGVATPAAAAGGRSPRRREGRRRSASSTTRITSAR